MKVVRIDLALALAATCALSLAACSAEMASDDAGSEVDAPSARLDARVDAPRAQCASDGDCATRDGDYCNGAETCDPDDASADSFGCVGATSPCLASQTCDEEEDRCVTDCPGGRDADGDDYDSIDCGGFDCDDSKASVHPGAAETCDAADVDEDCDSTTFGIRDLDVDGEPDGNCCNADPDGGADHCGTDCDDTRAGVSPVASETCNDRDDDCDTKIDEGELDVFFPDVDGDDFGDPEGEPVEACFQPEGYAARPTDCDDENSGVNPGLGERCDAEMLDENCDGMANPDSLCTCTDGLARPCTAPGACSSGTEICADGAWGACSIAPVDETCNRVDDNCDGSTDELLTVVCYADVDNDGYGATGAALSNECPSATRPAVGGCPNFTTNRAPMGGAIDCADGDPTRRPMAAELCNALDDDCDGAMDEGIRITCYVDADNDTYSPGGSSLECPAADRISVGGCPLGRTNRAPGAGTTDCNDGASDVRPGATETCAIGSTVDEDCDGSTDEGVAAVCYADTDGDLHAAAGAAATSRCRDATRPTVGFCPIAYTNRAPSGSVNDCAPTNAAIHPDAVETCALPPVDENCDGVANPASTCACGNGQVRACTLPGVCATGTEQCSGGAWGTCSVAPATETCDGRDEDCDGTVDDGLTVTCYDDGDNDTYAPVMASAQAKCPVTGRDAVGGCPVSFTNRMPGTVGTTDCNDASSSIRPGATELCSDSMAAVDEDCDGMLDELLRVTCYADGDSDTYAPSSSGATSRCADPTRPIVGNCPASFTNRAPGAGTTDCADAAAAVNPGATEVCDLIDSNCSSGGGVAPDEDGDGDGYAAIGATCVSGYPRTDCRDDAVSIHPGAAETCDRIDSNCSAGGGVETAEDSDGDGHSAVGAACTGGFPKDDCRDTNASVYTGQYAHFGTPYCASGAAPIRCSAGVWNCDGCGPVCGGCAPWTPASFDYDCSGTVTKSPVQTCTGATDCFGNSCRSGPDVAGGTCGETVASHSCSCGSIFLSCMGSTATSARFPCH